MILITSLDLMFADSTPYDIAEQDGQKGRQNSGGRIRRGTIRWCSPSPGRGRLGERTGSGNQHEEGETGA